MCPDEFFNADGSLVWWQQTFGGDPIVLANLRSGAIVTKADIAALANAMCTFFSRKSPFAFFSHPEKREQRFLALRRGEPFFGVICIAPELLPEIRRALVQALRLKGRVVSDLGTGQLMSATTKHICEHGPREIAIGMGFALPRVLGTALLEARILSRLLNSGAP